MRANRSDLSSDFAVTWAEVTGLFPLFSLKKTPVTSLSALCSARALRFSNIFNHLGVARVGAHFLRNTVAAPALAGPGGFLTQRINHVQMSNRRGLCNQLGAERRRVQKLRRKLANSQKMAAERGQPDPKRWAAFEAEIAEGEAACGELSARIRATHQRAGQEVTNAQR